MLGLTLLKQESTTQFEELGGGGLPRRLVS